MGNKNSGRYPRGVRKTKIKTFDLSKREDIQKVLSQKAPLQKEPVEPKPEPTIELVEENMDFEANAQRILKESAAAIEADKPKSKTDGIQNENPEPAVKKQEDWTPVAAMVMQALGAVLASSTKVPELNYTEGEINQCAPAISNLINLWFPDIEALTIEQQIMIINCSVIAKVHMVKFQIYMDAKKKKEVPVEPSGQTQPAAA